MVLSAIFANAVDLKRMARGEVVISAADFLFELADFLRKKFDRTAAIGTDHVVMAASIVLMFVAGDAIVKRDLARQAALREELQGAVNRGVPDASIFFLDQAMEFVGREMIAGFKKGVEYHIALRSLLQADIFEMAVKDFLGFADHLAGDGGLIIDALLQHVGSNKPQDIIQLS